MRAWAQGRAVGDWEVPVAAGDSHEAMRMQPCSATCSRVCRLGPRTAIDCGRLSLQAPLPTLPGCLYPSSPPTPHPHPPTHTLPTHQMHQQAAFCLEEVLLHQPAEVGRHLLYADTLYTLGGAANWRTARAYYSGAGRGRGGVLGVCGGVGA